MSAPIPPAKIRAVQKRRLRGERLKSIAAAEGVSLRTVQRICPAIDASVKLLDTPAAAFTADQVEVLAVLAATMFKVTCPNCGGYDVEDRIATEGTCRWCGCGWVVQRHPVAGTPSQDVGAETSNATLPTAARRST